MALFSLSLSVSLSLSRPPICYGALSLSPSLSLSLFAFVWGNERGPSPFPAHPSGPIHHFGAMGLAVRKVCLGVE